MSEPDFLRQQLQTMAPHRALLRSIECKFMSRVALVHPVLDVGCGDGHFASVAFQEAIDVGLDPMERDLPEAAAMRPATYVDVLRGSANQMPFRDGAFATVISNSVLEHIPDVDATLGEISRVLRTTGGFAMTTPSEHYPDFLQGSSAAKKLGLHGLGTAYGAVFNKISHHYHVDSPVIWTERLSNVGLTVIEHSYYFSPAAHRAFDLAHYLGLPNLVNKRLRGSWVVHPAQIKPFEWWYRRYYDEPLPEKGAYQFFLCVKRG